MKKVILSIMGLGGLLAGTAVLAATGTDQGIGSVAVNTISNLDSIARLITAAAYVAGFAFVVGAIAKFKAHKDNPTQIPIGTPIALLFVGAALIFITSVFGVTGATLFGGTGTVAGTQGASQFGATPATGAGTPPAAPAISTQNQ